MVRGAVIALRDDSAIIVDYFWTIIGHDSLQAAAVFGGRYFTTTTAALRRVTRRHDVISLALLAFLSQVFLFESGERLLG